MDIYDLYQNNCFEGGYTGMPMQYHEQQMGFGSGNSFGCGMPIPTGYGSDYNMNRSMMGCGYNMPVIKYNKSDILQGLCNYIIAQTGVIVARQEKLEETPELLRHACAPCGVSRLQMLNFSVPEMCLQVPFYFCKACGTLYYYKDFMM